MYMFILLLQDIKCIFNCMYLVIFKNWYCCFQDFIKSCLGVFVLFYNGVLNIRFFLMFLGGQLGKVVIIFMWLGKWFVNEMWMINLMVYRNISFFYSGFFFCNVFQIRQVLCFSKDFQNVYLVNLSLNLFRNCGFIIMQMSF